VQRCCNAPPSAAGTWLASSVEEQAQVLTALKKQVRVRLAPTNLSKHATTSSAQHTSP
jgi:hypothetical protein